MAAVTVAVAGMALYTNFVVSADIPGLPKAVTYLPAECDAVFGINVQKFLASPFFAKIEEEHGEQIGADLVEFIAKTGVDPRTDIDYIIAGGRKVDQKGEGVAIAVGKFNTAAITTFIHSESVPIEVQYKDAKVLMIPENNGNQLDKGIAFLSESEIALGDLESLKEVLDVRFSDAAGIESNEVIEPLLAELNPGEMFWFAGDASRILDKAPTNNPLGANIAAIQNVVGTLSLTEAVQGQITATARDVESATKLADVARGFIALGQLAIEQSPQHQELSELMQGITISQNEDKIQLMVNFPIELLEKLHRAKKEIKTVI
jgi:hypothetical protein